MCYCVQSQGGARREKNNQKSSHRLRRGHGKLDFSPVSCQYRHAHARLSTSGNRGKRSLSAQTTHCAPEPSTTLTYSSFLVMNIDGIKLYFTCLTVIDYTREPFDGLKWYILGFYRRNVGVWLLLVVGRWDVIPWRVYCLLEVYEMIL